MPVSPSINHYCTSRLYNSRTSDSEQCEEVQWAVMSCQAATYLGKNPALLPSYQAIPPRSTPKQTLFFTQDFLDDIGERTLST